MGKYQSTVVLSLISMYLIGGVYLLHCLTYPKHVALRDNLFNDRAICRAQSFRFEEDLCLNGLKPTSYYCATEDCDANGYNCKGHCLSGDDTSEVEHDIDLPCNTNSEKELNKLCYYYQERFDAYKVIMKLRVRNQVENIILPPPEITGISSARHPWNSGSFCAMKLKKLCPNINLTMTLQ